MERTSQKDKARSTSAKVVSYKVRNSKKRLLLIGNGCSSHCFGIQLGKTFKKSDAEKIVAVVNAGRF